MTRGVTSFVGQRLEEARLARGLTQTSLAQMVERNSSSVSSWENGRQLPDWETVDKISAVLGVRPSLFLQQLSEVPRSHYYRSNASITVGLQKKARARLRWAEVIAENLQEWIDFADVSIPDCDFASLADIDDQIIEGVAQDCRTFYELGRGPIENLIATIESAGCIVVKEELGGLKMDGVSVRSDIDQRPYILLADDKACAVRSRFDAAHEFGHLVLHRKIDPEDLTPTEYNEMERQAHRFASAFLMPEESFLRDVRYFDLDSFASLKTKWRVSIAAMIMRCAQLDIISEEHKKRLYISIGQRGWRKAEPLDDKIAGEVPTALSESIQLVIDSGKYTREGFLDLVGLNASDVESLAALPRGYMRREAAPVVRLRDR